MFHCQIRVAFLEADIRTSVASKFRHYHCKPLPAVDQHLSWHILLGRLQRLFYQKSSGATLLNQRMIHGEQITISCSLDNKRLPRSWEMVAMPQASTRYAAWSRRSSHSFLQQIMETFLGKGKGLTDGMTSEQTCGGELAVKDEDFCTLDKLVTRDLRPPLIGGFYKRFCWYCRSIIEHGIQPIARTNRQGFALPFYGLFNVTFADTSTAGWPHSGYGVTLQCSQ